MIFHGDDVAAQLGRVDNGVLVDGLDGVHVDDADAVALLFELTGRLDAVVDAHAGRDEVQVGAFLNDDRLADLVVIVMIRGVDQRLFTTRDADVDGLRIVQGLAEQLLALLGVARGHHGHVRQGVHNAELDDGVVRGAIARGQTGVGADETDGIVVVSHVVVDLVERTDAEKRAEGLHVGQEAFLREARRDRDHVHFLNTDVEDAIRIAELRLLDAAAAASAIRVDIAYSGIVFDHFQNLVGNGALGLHHGTHITAAKCKSTHCYTSASFFAVYSLMSFSASASLSSSKPPMCHAHGRSIMKPTP